MKKNENQKERESGNKKRKKREGLTKNANKDWKKCHPKRKT